jgi:hypothetical protein
VFAWSEGGELQQNCVPTRTFQLDGQTFQLDDHRQIFVGRLAARKLGFFSINLPMIATHISKGI